MRKTLHIAFAFLILLGFTNFSNKKKEKFEGEEKFISCLANVPLFYSTRNEPKLKEACEVYKDIELALITSTKNGKATYMFYYLVGEQTNNSFYGYLEKPIYHNKEGKKEAYFIKYQPKKQTFYKADCFRKILSENKDLTSVLTEIN